MKSIEKDKTELGKAHLTYGKLSLEEANARLKQEGESEFPLNIFPRFIQDTFLNCMIMGITISIIPQLAY